MAADPTRRTAAVIHVVKGGIEVKIIKANKRKYAKSIIVVLSLCFVVCSACGCADSGEVQSEISTKVSSFEDTVLITEADSEKFDIKDIEDTVHIDPVDFSNYLSNLTKYVASDEDVKDADLLRICARRMIRLGECYYEPGASPYCVLDEDELNMAIHAMFDVSEDYLESRKDDNISITGFEYLPDRGEFFFKTGVSFYEDIVPEIKLSGYQLDEGNLSIEVNGKDITAFGLINGKDDVKSIKYHFEIINTDIGVFYKYIDIELYDDPRHDFGEISINGERVPVDYCKITQKGITEYFVAERPYPSSDVLPFWHVDDIVDNTGIFVHDGKLYIPVCIDNVMTTYVCDPVSGDGRYINGNDIQAVNTEYPTQIDFIVSNRADLSKAVMRSSINEDGLSGEYYLYDLESGEKEYICQSYNGYTDHIPGTRIETCIWDDDGTLHIIEYSLGKDPIEHVVKTKE